MLDVKLRTAIAHEAARLLYDQIETEYQPAKIKAARRLSRGRCDVDDLPSNAEIRQILQTFAFHLEGDRPWIGLRALRLAALEIMRELAEFQPIWLNSPSRANCDEVPRIELLIATNDLDAVTRFLDDQCREYIASRQLTGTGAVAEVVIDFETGQGVDCRLIFDQGLTLAIDGDRGTEPQTLQQLESLIQLEHTGALDAVGEIIDTPATDPYPVFRVLLQPLEGIQQRPDRHPEGDVLYHSLQVFELARQARPYDVDFLLAALLHDVGKGIEPGNHVEAGVRALRGLVSDRTLFLIQHHPEAQAYRDGTLASKRRDRLRSHEDFDDLLLLEECDRAGRVPGAVVCSLDEALRSIRTIERENDA